MNDDIDHIAQFLQGEQTGFEKLVRKYQNRVLNIIYSLIGTDRESEDIAQEVFLKVYYGLKSFRREAHFSTWLYRMTVNMTYDFLRRRKPVVNDESAVDRLAARDADPRQALAAKERAVLLQKAMENVPLHYRSALVLKDIEGLSYEQIAKVLHCRIGTVESKIYRARQFLRQNLLRLEIEAML